MNLITKLNKLGALQLQRSDLTADILAKIDSLNKEASAIALPIDKKITVLTAAIKSEVSLAGTIQGDNMQVVAYNRSAWDSAMLLKLSELYPDILAAYSETLIIQIKKH